MIGIGALLKAVLDECERYAASPCRLMITESVTHHDGCDQAISLDDTTQVHRLWESCIAPTLEVVKQITQPGQAKESLDVPGLAVADDEESVMFAKDTKTLFDTGIDVAAHFLNHAAVLNHRLINQGPKMVFG